MLKINQRFKDVIPPLSPEEFMQLEENIINEGCRDSLVVWGDIIVDGHNRFAICCKHNLPFKTISKEFESEEHAIIWIVNNQKGRRNVTDGWKWELAQIKKQSLEIIGREKLSEAGREGGRGNIKPLSPSDKPFTQHNTQKEIATELGWSTGKVAQADYVWKNASEEIKQKVKTGEETIKGAYVEVKKEIRKQEIEEQLKEIEKGVQQSFSGEYEIISIDPPWGYGSSYDPQGRRITSPYPEMSQEDLKKINLPAAENCVLFLWTTQKFIWEAKELLDLWGFNYRAIITWDKQIMGIGNLIRMQCEFCLIGIKGTPVFKPNHSIRDIICEQRREHSRKPEGFYKLVDSLCVGRKLDYFSREKRLGWDSYGNDTQKFTEETL